MGPNRAGKCSIRRERAVIISVLNRYGGSTESNWASKNIRSNCRVCSVPSQINGGTAIKVGKRAETCLRAEVLEVHRQLAPPVGVLAVGGAWKVDRVACLENVFKLNLDQHGRCAGEMGVDSFT